MNGPRLYADGDDDEPQTLNPERQQDEDIDTIGTNWSVADRDAFAIVRAMGYTKDQGITFVQILQRQINNGHSHEWASAFAIKKLEGASDEEAKIAADKNTHSKVYMDAYEKAICSDGQERGKEFAEKYARAYEAQKLAKRSDDWAKRYAAMIAHDKTEVYAYFYAQKMTEGQSRSWATAYASAVEASGNLSFAARLAAVYTEKRKTGMPKEEAQKEACLIAADASGNDININSQDKNGDTDLHKAVRQNQIIWVQTLLSTGALCTLQNEDGKTPLIIASAQGSPYLVARLLNADLTSKEITDKEGTTALTWARNEQSRLPQGERNRREQYNSVIRMLEHNGVDENGVRRLIKMFLPTSGSQFAEGIQHGIQLGEFVRGLV